MNRTTVRVAALGLAMAITVLELLGIALLADHVSRAGDSVVVLPRVTVIAAGVDDLGHYFDDSSVDFPTRGRASEAQMRTRPAMHVGFGINVQFGPASQPPPDEKQR